MSSTMRWRYGDTSPIVMPVDSATVIEIGDLLYRGTGSTFQAIPPSEIFAYENTLEYRKDFAELFAGVAMQQSRAGDTQDIRVATSGVFEFECEPATFEVGDWIAVAFDPDTGMLCNQRVVAVTEESLAIGRCVKRVNPADKSVLVDIGVETKET